MKKKKEAEANDWLTSDTEQARAIRFLAEHTDVSPNQARDIIDRHGLDRKTILGVAQTRKAEG